MNELIKIETNENGDARVSGRELHAFLEVETPYHKWFPRMAEYGFTEDEDFSVTDKNVHNSNGGKQSVIDHMMTLDMAKELCMIQRTERGKQARQYFLQVEKDWNSPQKIMARELALAEKELAKELATIRTTVQVQQQQIAELQPKATYYDLLKKDGILPTIEREQEEVEEAAEE